MPPTIPDDDRSVGEGGGPTVMKGPQTPPPISPCLCSSHASATSSPTQSPAGGLGGTRGSLLELLESQNRHNCAEAVRRASMASIPDYTGLFQPPQQVHVSTPKSGRTPRQPQTPPGRTTLLSRDPSAVQVKAVRARRSSQQVPSQAPLFTAACARSSSLNSALSNRRSRSNGMKANPSAFAGPSPSIAPVSSTEDLNGDTPPAPAVLEGLPPPVPEAGGSHSPGVAPLQLRRLHLPGGLRAHANGNGHAAFAVPGGAFPSQRSLPSVSHPASSANDDGSSCNDDGSGEEHAAGGQAASARLDADIACAMKGKSAINISGVGQGHRRRGSRRSSRDSFKGKPVHHHHAPPVYYGIGLGCPSSDDGCSSRDSREGDSPRDADDCGDCDSTDEGMNTCVISASHLAAQMGGEVLDGPAESPEAAPLLSGPVACGRRSSAASLPHQTAGDPQDPMLSAAIAILVEFESYKRERMAEGFFSELNIFWKRHEDAISLIFTSQSLIRGVEEKHASDSLCSALGMQQQHSGLSGVGLRSSLKSRTANNLAGTNRSRVGLSESILGRSLGRSTKNNSMHYEGSALNGTYATLNELSSTQATVVVRESQEDVEEVQKDIPSWADCLDKDACLTRASKHNNGVQMAQLAQSCLSYNAPLGSSLRSNDYDQDLLSLYAEREKARLERETRQMLMTYVAPEKPEAAIHISVDGEGQPVTLGKGSYGSVYHATMAATGEERAVKIVYLDHLENGEADLREVVLNEIVILSNSCHPHIVSYFGTFFHSTANELWCVMECCKGNSLFDVIYPPGKPQRTLKDFEIVKVCVDILSALSYLCGKGYIHRDVKPENVLSDGVGAFKLSDFGLSRLCHIDEEHKSSSIEGTLQYLAPEGFQDLRGLITGVPQCSTSHRGDIYSFGMCVLVMAGVDITRNITRPETYKVPSFDPYSYGPKKVDMSKRMSSLLFSFVSLCLKDDVKQRPTADMLLKHDFIVSYVSSGMSASFDSFCTGNTTTDNDPRPHANAHLVLPVALASSAESKGNGRASATFGTRDALSVGSAYRDSVAGASGRGSVTHCGNGDESAFGNSAASCSVVGTECLGS